MKDKPSCYDIAIVGSGLSGLSAALTLSEAGQSVIIIEQGNDLKKSVCELSLQGLFSKCFNCNKLHGIGGAAAHFDVNLSYYKKFDLNRLSIDKKKHCRIADIFNSETKARFFIDKAFSILLNFGLVVSDVIQPYPNNLNVNKSESTVIANDYSISISLQVMVKILSRLVKYLKGNGVNFKLLTKVLSLKKSQDDSIYEILVQSRNKQSLILAKHVIIATGRLSGELIKNLIQKAGLEATLPSYVEVGVRIESSASLLNEMLSIGNNPKMSITSSNGLNARTFCYCKSGSIFSYKLRNQLVIDGRHSFYKQTEYANFGLLVSVPSVFLKLEQENIIDYAFSYAKKLTSLTPGFVPYQNLNDFRGIGIKQGGTPPTMQPIYKSKIANLRQNIPFYITEAILEIINKINDIHGSIILPTANVYAPAIENCFHKILLNDKFESNISGVYFVGDCSGNVTGIISGMAMAIYAAENINENY